MLPIIILLEKKRKEKSITYKKAILYMIVFKISRYIVSRRGASKHETRD